jgi:hypothetical protein
MYGCYARPPALRRFSRKWDERQSRVYHALAQIRVAEDDQGELYYNQRRELSFQYRVDNYTYPVELTLEILDLVIALLCDCIVSLTGKVHG